MGAKALTNIGLNMRTGTPLFTIGDTIPENHPELKNWVRYGWAIDSEGIANAADAEAERQKLVAEEAREAAKLAKQQAAEEAEKLRDAEIKEAEAKAVKLAQQAKLETDKAEAAKSTKKAFGDR